MPHFDGGGDTLPEACSAPIGTAFEDPRRQALSDHPSSLLYPAEAVLRSLSRDSRLVRVKTLVEANLARPICLQDAAEAAKLEAKYFSRVFIQKTGWRFATWLRVLRVARAAQLLSTTELAIAQIAARIYYGDLGALERNFKRLLGLAPRSYRRQVHDILVRDLRPG